MCRWIAYAGPEIYLSSLIFETEYSLIHQSMAARQGKTAINADGFGVGWFGARSEPGVFKDIQPAWNDENLKSVTHQIESRLFFAHIRASTGTPASRVNCHPFRSGHWMFMHNGRIGGFDRVRRQLMMTLTPAAFDALRGATDSELMFRMMTDNGLDDDPHGALSRTVGQICAFMTEAGVDDPLTMTVAFTDGRTIYAARFANAGEPPTLYYKRDVSIEGEDSAPGSILIVSEPLDDVAAHWAAVDPSQMLVSGPEGVVLSAFEPVCSAA